MLRTWRRDYRIACGRWPASTLTQRVNFLKQRFMICATPLNHVSSTTSDRNLARYFAFPPLYMVKYVQIRYCLVFTLGAFVLTFLQNAWKLVSQVSSRLWWQSCSIPSIPCYQGQPVATIYSDIISVWPTYLWLAAERPKWLYRASDVSKTLVVYWWQN